MTWNESRPVTAKQPVRGSIPTANRVLFASTQDDRGSREDKQKEIELRNSGKQRRYAWDYDDKFEIYSRRYRRSGEFTRLTDARGYDAEGEL